MPATPRARRATVAGELTVPSSPGMRAASLSKHGSIAALGGIHQRLMPSVTPPPGRDLGRSRRPRTTLRSLPSGLGELGIGEDDLTTEQYSDAVMHASA